MIFTSKYFFKEFQHSGNLIVIDADKYCSSRI